MVEVILDHPITFTKSPITYEDPIPLPPENWMPAEQTPETEDPFYNYDNELIRLWMLSGIHPPVLTKYQGLFRKDRRGLRDYIAIKIRIERNHKRREKLNPPTAQ